MFKILISKKAKKELAKFTKEQQAIIRADILLLKKFPQIQKTKKLKGENDLFRTRGSNFRIIFKVLKNTEVIKITHIRKRNEKTYKNL